MVSSVDGVLHHLGKPGGYHLLVAVLLCSNYFPIAFHQMSNVFYSTDIAHNCRLPEGWPWHKKFSIPIVATVGGQTKYDECRMFIDPNSAKLGTKSCVYGWEFFPRSREWTINAEWGLVCERDYLVTLATTMYYGGAMFGGLVFGTLADKFGRRPLLLFALYAQAAASVGVYFVRSFILYAILRFVHALLLQGLQATTLCLLVELPLFRPPSSAGSPSSISRGRTLALFGCSITSAIASICLALITVSVQHWRYIQLAITLPCVVTIIYMWLIPESVRWLVTLVKSDSAVSMAHKFAGFNRRSLDDHGFVRDVEAAAKQLVAASTMPSASGVGGGGGGDGDADNYGLRELLFNGPILRVCTLVLCFGWFSASALHQALSQSLLDVAADTRLSVLVVGFVDLVSFVLMYFLLTRFGRKKPLCALLVLSGAICISTVMAQNLERGAGSLLEVRIVTTVLTLVERSCMAACLSGLTVCAAEIFPTVVRAFGIGVCLFCGQAGWIAAPYILKLSVVTMKAIPWVFLGSLVLVSGILVQLLPEMYLKHLPDTLEDVEALESRKKQPKKSESGAELGSSTTTTTAISSVDVGQSESVTPTAMAGTTTTTPAEDYRAHIASVVEGQNAKLESAADKRWYQKNYSRKSAKVVRFYGLDGGLQVVEDPCREAKNGKKEAIRMVRFSFENEEFRVDPRSPMKVRRFSVINEESELEVADEESVESSKTMHMELAQPPSSNVSTTRFVVKRIDNGVSLENGVVLSVQRFNDDDDNSKTSTKQMTNDVARQPEKVSRFCVQRVLEDRLITPPDVKKPSRFIVQKVTDDFITNEKEMDNNNEKCVADKNVDHAEADHYKEGNVETTMTTTTNIDVAVSLNS